MGRDALEAPAVVREWTTVPPQDWPVLFGSDSDPFGIEALKLQWQPKDTHFVLYLEDRAASHVSLALGRRVRVGSETVEVTGVSGVITRPDLRRRGLAARLLDHALRETRGRCQSCFSFLFCLPELVPLYRRLGWQQVAFRVHIRQPSGVVEAPLRAMVLSMGDAAWPAGAVGLDEAPW